VHVEEVVSSEFSIDFTGYPEGGLLGGLLCGLADGIDLPGLDLDQLIGRVDDLLDGLFGLTEQLDRLDDLTDRLGLLGGVVDRVVDNLVDNLVDLAGRVDSLRDLDRFIDLTERLAGQLDRIIDIFDRFV
jgi:hypothetical protein